MKKIIITVILLSLLLVMITGCLPPQQIQKETQKTRYQPKPATTWHWQLTGLINTGHDADMYDIDLETTPQEIIDELHVQGKKVICYFSAGSVESFRTDARQFPQQVIGKPMKGWPEEAWLNSKKYGLFASIMEKRLDLAVQKKCDGVEADNVDAYQQDTEFLITYNDQMRYNRWLAEQAHKRNLSIGLKNNLKQIKDLADVFDFAVNERCFEYQECHLLLPFVEKKKAVFGVEYALDPEEFCAKASQMGFSWLKMDEELDGQRIACGK